MTVLSRHVVFFPLLLVDWAIPLPLQVVALAKELQEGSGKRVLWGTAQLFKHPRYMHGAATSEY